MQSRVQGVLLSLVLLVGIILLWIFIRNEARRSLRYQLELAHLRDELTAANQSLKSLANADGLTGLANRRYFDQFLKKACSMRAAAAGRCR